MSHSTGFTAFREQFDKIKAALPKNCVLPDPEDLLGCARPGNEVEGAGEEVVKTVYYDPQSGRVFEDRDELCHDIASSEQYQTRQMKSQTRYLIKDYELNPWPTVNTGYEALMDRARELRESFECFMSLLSNDKILVNKEKSVEPYYFEGYGLTESEIGYEENIVNIEYGNTVLNQLRNSLKRIVAAKQNAEQNRRKIKIIVEIAILSISLFSDMADYLYYVNAYNTSVGASEATLSAIKELREEVLEGHAHVCTYGKMINNCRTWVEDLLERLTEIQQLVVDALLNNVMVASPDLGEELEELNQIATTASFATLNLTKRRTTTPTDHELEETNYVLIPPGFEML